VRTVGSAAPVAFPVGNASYNPVTARMASGTDRLRVAVLDEPDAGGLTPDAHLARAWAVASIDGPGSGGDVALTVQWNDGEQGPAFQRAVGGANGALARRLVGAAWTPQSGVLISDNGLFPAVATLAAAPQGLWTLGSQSWVSGVETGDAPLALQFAPVWPNPLRGSATVRYGLPRRGRATIDVYSVRGERVATLVDGDQDAGWLSARVDSRRIASGVYFLRLQSGGEMVSNKVVVVR